MAQKSAVGCFKELTRTADAIYVALHMGINEDTIPTLVDIAHSTQTPTFSQAGADEVRYGFLMSISHADFQYVGQFYAETMEEYPK